MLTKEDTPAETVTPNAPKPVALDDEKLLERAKAASNGADFQRLWAGVTTDYNSDHSGADMAFCCRLAFWTGRDAERMDRLFRASGLMRDKWDGVHHSDDSTYGGKTISRAIAKTSEVYTPKIYHNGHNGSDKSPIGEDVAALLGDVAGLNGYGPGHSDGGTLPDVEESAGNDDSVDNALSILLDELLEQLAEMEGDREEVTLFALDNVSILAGMDKIAIATFCAHLRTRGVTAEWIRTDLRPAINEAKKEQARQESGGFGLLIPAE